MPVYFPVLLLLIPVHLPVFQSRTALFTNFEALLSSGKHTQIHRQAYPVRHRLRLPVFSKRRIVRDSQMHL